MKSSLSTLLMGNRSLFLTLLTLLLVSPLFLLLPPATSADNTAHAKADSVHPLYATAKRAAFSKAMATIKSSPEEVESLSFTPCVDGMADIFPCHKVDLMAFMTLNDIGGSETNDIWGWTDPLDGKEYAVVGRTNGTSFVDISNASNPIYLGQLPPHNNINSLWRSLKVYQNHAFIVSEATGHGMQVFDLTQLRNVTNPPVTFSETAHYSGFGSAHTIAVNEDTGYAYAVGSNMCNAGLAMVDISNPLNPTNAGCFGDDGYTHETQCATYNGPDVDFQGNEICFNANEDTLTIVDVTDKDNVFQVARQGYQGAAYTHQGWLTEDHKYFLLDDELDESNNGHNTYTYIWDVQDLSNPQVIGIYESALPSIDHNLYIKGDFAYQSNYTAGLRVLNLSDIANANLEEVAYFDVYPDDDATSFNGTWSNYPYFPSGTIIVTSRQYGLFIVQALLESDFSLSSTPSTLDLCIPDDALYNIEVASFDDFNQEITLDVSGEPAGATVDFSVNPIMPSLPPATSTLTIRTEAATPGNFNINIVGMALTKTHTVTVGLNLTGMVGDGIMLLSPPDMASHVLHKPIFEWTAVEQAESYMLSVATDLDFSNVIYNATSENTRHEATISLQPNTTYYWHVTAMNDCHTAKPSEPFTFTTQPPTAECSPGSQPTIVFNDDFESGGNGWTSGSHVGSNTWELSSEETHSEHFAYHAESISTVSDQWLMSPAITLPTEQGPLSLQFFNHQSLEHTTQGCKDGGILEISSDGGKSWAQILEKYLLSDPYDGVIGNEYLNPLADLPAWCGDPQDWLNSIVDLTQFEGETVQFRWRLGTDSFGSDPGWSIDDVVVQSCVLEDEHEDQDEDGVDNEIETEAPNNGDGNGDGIADSQQEYVTSLPNQGSDDGYVTLVAPVGSSLVEVEALTMPFTLPNVVINMPQGLFNFSIENIEPGAEISLTLYLENNNSPLNNYWKYDQITGEWNDYSEYASFGKAKINENIVSTITLTLTDGGIGDHDNEVNGRIVDPSGPTLQNIPTSIQLAKMNSQSYGLIKPGFLAVLLLAIYVYRKNTSNF